MVLMRRGLISNQNMQTTSNFYCRQIIDVLAAQGVRTAYCSPGSRNAPLLIALESHPEIEKIVVVDERSAAFQALGCALVQQNPVVLVCTSGTAMLNYAPALAEAYYAGVPLIAISADRPREWIDQDDSQTIRQYDAFSHFVKGSYDIRAIPEGLAADYSAEVKWTVNRTVNEAFLKAIEGNPGPVHINVQLTDPLGRIDECEDAPQRCVRLIKSDSLLLSSIIDTLAKEASQAKILLVAGFHMPSNWLDGAVRMLASMPNVALMVETISNIHQVPFHANMVDSVLCEMSEEEKEAMRPDIVISFGGSLVSRMLKQYLRSYPPKRHWGVGFSNYFCDCFQALTDRIEMKPASFLRHLHGRMRKYITAKSPAYSKLWEDKKRQAYNRLCDFSVHAPWSDFKAMDDIFSRLKIDNLFVSNGTCVRYSQIFYHKCHAEYCNRGVSGIDGTTATAVGAANAYSGKTLLLTGDMSWLYDSGASTLWNVPPRMRIIVIDNSGGGIFRFIKSTSGLPEDILQRYFCVDGLPDAAAIAEAYGIETMHTYNHSHLVKALKWLSLDSDLPRMLVVHTPPQQSAEVLKSFFNKP